MAYAAVGPTAGRIWQGQRRRSLVRLDAIMPPVSFFRRSDDLGDEAKQKNCQYVVYTRLTELRSQQDPYQHQAGAIETNPNSQWSSQNPSLQQQDPEYRATVNYKLVEVSSNSAVSGAPFSTQQNGNEIDTVSQIMDRIALQVADQIKKGTPAMRE